MKKIQSKISAWIGRRPMSRSNDQVAEIYREDTESSRAIAQEMGETADEEESKVVVFSSPRRPSDIRRFRTTAQRPLEIEIGSGSRDEAETVAGIISVATADVEEQNASTEQLGTDATLARTLQARDLDFDPFTMLSPQVITAVRERMQQNSTETQPPRQDHDINQRLVGILRRINELQTNVSPRSARTGLSPSRIRTLPCFQYTARDHGDGSENTHCTVCMCEFQVEEQIRALPCFHIYHRECIDEWLRNSGTCPICKHAINSNIN